MEVSEFLGPMGGALAVACFVGGSTVAVWMWKFIVVPLKAERDAATNELKQKLIDDLNELRTILNTERSRA